jgi:mannose-6-phosphate isomerase-like protein (cupin superfamily)
MKSTRKYILCGITCLVIAAGLSRYTLAQEDAASSATYLDQQKVQAAFTHPIPIPDMVAGKSSSGNYRVRAGRHDDPTQVEVHTLDTDVFYVTSGSATLVTGGTPVDLKQTTPTELRGVSLTGGTPHHLTKGDVMVIPNGIPHWFQEIQTAPFLYFEVKVR